MPQFGHVFITVDFYVYLTFKSTFKFLNTENFSGVCTKKDHGKTQQDNKPQTFRNKWSANDWFKILSGQGYSSFG
ncbi:hypothetical protein GCM10011506_04420 [Marivirga lumbricoides]|uniref:Uncharacterized protein n=1 Tax=Marivirga lumbricoides TaxID=1046115 RepID=A0ABQ1LB38_9BACT|nr:hypothetical protein GCM10011506_04420 [Marivirga lumbricoides]